MVVFGAFVTILAANGTPLPPTHLSRGWTARSDCDILLVPLKGAVSGPDRK